MKLAFITDSIDLKSVGIGTYIRNLLNNFPNELDMTLLHLSSIDDELYKKFKNKTVWQNILFPKIPWRNLFLLPLNLKEYDIVHFPDFHIFPYFKQKCKVVETVHDLIPIIMPNNVDAHNFYKYFLSINLKNADTIITVSETTKNDLLKHFKIKNKIKVVYEGIDERFKKIENTKEFREKYKLNCPFILFIGRLEERKNLPMLIRAFSKANEKLFNYKLVLCGSRGWKFNKIEETINDLNLQVDVKILNGISNEELPLLYNSAEFFVFPTLYEGFGIPPLEAMACKIPVLSSNAGSLPEILGDSCLYFNPQSKEEITNAILKLAIDENLRKELIAKGEKRVKMFSWKKCAEETIKIYEELHEK